MQHSTHNSYHCLAVRTALAHCGAAVRVAALNSGSSSPTILQSPGSPNLPALRVRLRHLPLRCNFLKRGHEYALACSVFERVEQRALQEQDKNAKAAMRKMGRRLRSVHEELAQYNALIALFFGAPDFEWESLVASSRPALTQAFFSHVEMLIRTTSDASKREGEPCLVITPFMHA